MQIRQPEWKSPYIEQVLNGFCVSMDGSSLCPQMWGLSKQVVSSIADGAAWLMGQQNPLLWEPGWGFWRRMSHTLCLPHFPNLSSQPVYAGSSPTFHTLKRAHERRWELLPACTTSREKAKSKGFSSSWATLQKVVLAWSRRMKTVRCTLVFVHALLCIWVGDAHTYAGAIGGVG